MIAPTSPPHRVAPSATSPRAMSPSAAFLCLASLCLACALALPAWGAPPAGRLRLSDPTTNVTRLPSTYYGSDTDVNLLAGVLDDDDPLLREHAATDLGQTRNPSALAVLTHALSDKAPTVRRAAAAALAELALSVPSCRPKALALLAGAFADKDPQMAWALLRAARQLQAKDAPILTGLRGLLQREEPAIVAAALETLTDLGQAVASLEDYLRSPHPAIRLRAARGAMLHKGKASKKLVDALADRAELEAIAAVRGAALASLGALDLARARDLLEDARKDDQPLVRRGALDALAYGRRREAIRPFLDDPSPMVRLAAVHWAGRLRCEDCAGRLFELMLASPYDDWFEKPHVRTRPPTDAHWAARTALCQIASAGAADLAAAHLAPAARELRRRERLRAGVQYPPSPFGKTYGTKHVWTLTPADLLDADALLRLLHGAGQANAPSPARGLWRHLPNPARRLPTTKPLSPNQYKILADGLNAAMRRVDLYTIEDFAHVHLVPEARDLLTRLLRERPADGKKAVAAALKRDQLARFNRELVEAATAGLVRPGPHPYALGVLRRDVMADAAILAACGDRRGNEAMRMLLSDLPIDSIALIGICRALTDLGDTQSLPLLRQAVQASQKNGLKYLIAAASLQPPPLPFDERVSAAFVTALGDRKDPKAFDGVLALAQTQLRNVHLTAPAVAACDALPRLAHTPAQKKRARAWAVSVLGGDDGYAALVRFHAIRTAVRLKANETVAPLEKMLTVERSQMLTMQAAAWGLQELTGTTPSIPQPKRHPGDWIIRAIRPRR